MKAPRRKHPPLVVLVLGSALALGSWAPRACSQEDIPMAPDVEERAAEAARKKDPAWKPALRELTTIKIGKSNHGGSVHNYCLDPQGNILACCGGSFNRILDASQGRTESASEPAEVRVYSPDGRQLRRWPLEAKPQAICVAPDGSIFVAGGGRVVRLDSEGKVLASVPTPVASEAVEVGDEIKEMLKSDGRLNKTELKRMKEMLEQRRQEVTGIAVTAQDVFVACPAPNDFTYRVYRFDHGLKESKLVVQKLRGCCGQMDIQARGEHLWIPHNARHRIECRDRDGKEITQFGKRGRVKPQDFGGCCEPKNIRMAANGDILAAESGPPTCIKRYDAKGKFLGLVALPTAMRGDCVRVTVEVSPDASRYYLLDTENDLIRVFGSKS